MDDLKNLDEATLKQLLDSASSYDERSAIRKEIRERKKKSGQAAGTSIKGTYSRFAGGRTVVDTKTKSFLPLSTTTPSNRVNSPSFLNTPPAAPSPEPTQDNSESKRAEKKREDEIRQEEEERNRRQEIEQEVKRQERIKREKELEKEAELKLEHERELEREADVKRQEEERVRELKRIQDEEEERREEEERLEKRREEEERLEKRREEEEEERLEKRREEEEERLEKRREEEEEERLELLKRREEERLEKRREEEEEMGRIQEERRLLETKEQEQSEIMENEKEETPPPTIRVNKDETDLGTSPFGVQLKSRGSTKGTSSPKRTPEPSGPEFSKVNLKKTDSSENRIKPNSNKSPGFLKTQTGSVYTSSTRERSSSYNTTPTTRGTGAAPKTLADYQKLGTRNRSNTSPGPHNNKPLSDSSLQAKLVHYVNASLNLRPPMSSTGTALYDTCKRPSILCNLINKSVRGTVDLRALTKTPPPSAGRREKQEAIEENMTLVVESARAIGCSITDETETNLIKGDPPTIRSFLIQMIRARVVNLPGMEDEPSTTFEDFTVLMEKLGLGSQEDHDGEQEPDIADEPKKKLTWREHDSDRLRQELERKDEEQDTSPQPIRGTWREERSKVTPEVDLSRPSLNAELTYEERAVLRRLEREKKRKEREKLAVGK